jgi:hypothetical protein
MTLKQLTITRRRGGQPGNQNAKGNRGNPHPRANRGNRGGHGAPEGNQYARKAPPTLDQSLLAEYGREPQVAAWIVAHAAELRELRAERDAVSFSVYCGLTPEALAQKGLEYRYGLFHLAPQENYAEELELVA